MDDIALLLQLQVEWGADEALDLDPIDRLRLVEGGSVPLRRRVLEPVGQIGMKPGAEVAPVGRVAPVLPKGTPVERAVALAGQAVSLDDLRAALAGFDGCALRDTASNLVFAEGDPASTTLIIGEPPGREEDRSGQPFAGPEGQLLDEMLASVRLTRLELMLAPLLPWRPPGGRPPSAGEMAVCLPFLHRLVMLLKPERIVLFGGLAARALLPQAPNRRRAARAWAKPSIPGMTEVVPVLGLPGLAEMVKNPSLRRDAWAGLRMLRRAIDESRSRQ